jgi:hypothetical protein
MSDVVRRFLTLLFAAAQFALPAAASIADGLAARATGNTTSHVESVAGTHCTPAHSADCTLCRYLSGTSADIATASFCFSQTTGGQVVPSLDAAARSAAHFHARSRAPPMLLV